jgi:hypothetical protein
LAFRRLSRSGCFRAALRAAALLRLRAALLRRAKRLRAAALRRLVALLLAAPPSWPSYAIKAAQDAGYLPKNTDWEPAWMKDAPHQGEAAHDVFARMKAHSAIMTPDTTLDAFNTDAKIDALNTLAKPVAMADILENAMAAGAANVKSAIPDKWFGHQDVAGAKEVEVKGEVKGAVELHQSVTFQPSPYFQALVEDMKKLSIPISGNVGKTMGGPNAAKSPLGGTGFQGINTQYGG